MRFVLVHSPLVGPATWRRVASELGRRGHRTLVPSLLGPAGHGPRTWHDCVAAVREALGESDDAIVLAGHSGAGPLLPAMTAAVSAPVAALVFVDAGLPPASGETRLVPEEMLDELRPRADHGLLPQWFRWWPADTMQTLIPDVAVRAAVQDEMPRVSLAYLEQRIPVQAGWDDRPCGYLLLSSAYVDAAEDARRRGWPVVALHPAEHLHLVVNPADVADAVVRLAAG